MELCDDLSRQAGKNKEKKHVSLLVVVECKKKGTLRFRFSHSPLLLLTLLMTLNRYKGLRRHLLV